MKKAIILLGLLLTTTAHAEIVIDKLPDPSYLNSNGTPVAELSKQERATLSMLERKMFNQAYSDIDPISRIERLERYMLGAIQSGDTVRRINTLKTACSSIESDPYRTNQINPYQRQSGFKNIVKNILGGTMTGYSPPVNYSGYAPNMGFNGLYQGNYTNMPNSNFKTFTPFKQARNQGFYNPYNAQKTYFQDIYSDSGGNEMYYTDGQFRKDLKTTGGGCSVTIID